MRGMHSSHRQRQDHAQQEYKDRYWFRYVKALYTPTDVNVAIFQSPTTLPNIGYADITIFHVCLCLWFAQVVCLSLRYSCCPVSTKMTNEATLTGTESWYPFIRNIPGYRVILSPTSALGYILPKIPVICRGNNHVFEDKLARTLIFTNERQRSWFRCSALAFESADWDVTSIVWLLLLALSCFYWHLYKGHIPRLDYETFEAAESYQGGFWRITGTDFTFYGHLIYILQVFSPLASLILFADVYVWNGWRTAKSQCRTSRHL